MIVRALMQPTLLGKYVGRVLHPSHHFNFLFERARKQGADMDGLVADLLRNLCSRALRDDGIFLSPSRVESH